jgi:hypothetical protein
LSKRVLHVGARTPFLRIRSRAPLAEHGSEGVILPDNAGEIGQWIAGRGRRLDISGLPKLALKLVEIDGETGLLV